MLISNRPYRPPKKATSSFRENELVVRISEASLALAFHALQSKQSKQFEKPPPPSVERPVQLEWWEGGFQSLFFSRQMSDVLSSSIDLQRPESLHTADSLTEVTAVESHGSGDTEIVELQEQSSLNNGTGSNDLANGSASEVESFMTIPSTTLAAVQPVVGDIDDILSERLNEVRWNAVRLSEIQKEKDPDLVASFGYLQDLRESLENSDF